VTVADRVVARPIHHVHRALADRVFRLLGPVGAPVRVVHDAISEGAHVAVRGSLRGVGVLAGVVASHRARGNEHLWHERSPIGSRLAAIAHGLVGDLAELAPALDLPLVVRQDGATIPVRRTNLAAAFPDATDRIAVFVHGLAEDDRIWDPSPSRPERISLPAALAAEGLTPVRIRYGSGAPIGRNGVALADLLQDLLDEWPQPVRQMVLVGHSMGGLIARSACAHANGRGHTWPAPLEHVAYLGAPHLGAPLERAVHRITMRLAPVAVAAPFVDILESRPVGVRDLRHGTLTEQVEELVDVVEPAVDEPWMEGVEHHLVVGRLAGHERHPVNRLFGDLLVTPPSALGRSRSQQRRIEGDAVHVLSVPTNHFGLCWHRDIADHLVSHLRGAAAEPDVA
jgi:pimeloyl-ACP methyl ester carboxylesterase